MDMAHVTKNLSHRNENDKEEEEEDEEKLADALSPVNHKGLYQG